VGPPGCCGNSSCGAPGRKISRASNLIAHRIEDARKLLPATVCDAAEIGYEDQRFDVIILSLVLSQITFRANALPGCYPKEAC